MLQRRDYLPEELRTGRLLCLFIRQGEMLVERGANGLLERRGGRPVGHREGRCGTNR